MIEVDSKKTCQMERNLSSATVSVLLLTLGLFSVSTRTLTAQSSMDEALFVLDYLQYVKAVEPIFLNRRPGHARCVVCHSRGGRIGFLEPLAPGAMGYDEEQSLRNFARVQQLVVPGAPLESVLLVNPLTEGVGGSHWHAGGKHWDSQDDPEWLALAAWVTGQMPRWCPRFIRIVSLIAPSWDGLCW